MKNCVKCGEKIHELRLKVLPNTKTCINCTTVNKKRGQIVTEGRDEDFYVSVEVDDN